jgi:ligand-binding sensor domain-containing protein
MRLPYALGLSEDAHSNLWIGSSDQILRWHDGAFEPYFRGQLEQNTGLLSFDTAVATDGSIWASIPVKGFGLYQFVEGSARKIVLAGIDTARVDSVFADREGSIWLATPNDGVYRLYGDRLDHFGNENGLSSNAVRGFFEDREGNLWVTTSKGLDCFHDFRVVTFSTGEGLAADLVSSVFASDDGTVWSGNRGALELLRGGKVTAIPIPGQQVTSLWEDHAQRLWVVVDNNLTVYDHGEFRKIKGKNGGPLGTAIAIAEDSENNVWVSVANSPKLLRIRDLRVQDEFTSDQIPYAGLLAADPTGGLWLGLVNGDLGHYRTGKLDIFPLHQGRGSLLGLTIDADGSAWAGTRNGVVHWKNGETKMLTSKNGLPCDGFYSVIRDNRGALWIYSKCGLISIADSELEQWWQHSGSDDQI